MPTPAVNTKTCSTCGLTQPADAFSRRANGKDGRRGRCRQCSRRYLRQWRARRQAKRLGKFASELARAQSLSRVVSLADEMIGRFGGVRRFAQLWASQIAAAASQKPGGAGVLRACGAIIKLAEVASAQTPTDFSGWTDADLEAESKRLLADG